MIAPLGSVRTVSSAWTPQPPSSLLWVLGGLMETEIKGEIKCPVHSWGSLRISSQAPQGAPWPWVHALTSQTLSFAFCAKRKIKPPPLYVLRGCEDQKG